jgi:threonine dehydrogenase-like Zn-dependent dehydrogenase
MAVDLTEKRILVVGAGGGIGAATARAFAGAGARVFAAGRPGPKLDSVAADIGGESVALDILDNDAIEDFLATAEPFDHVVIAAAATKSGPVARLPLDDAKTSMESKFWGAFYRDRPAEGHERPHHRQLAYRGQPDAPHADGRGQGRTMTKATVALAIVARVKRGSLHDHGPFVCRRHNDGASLRRGDRRRLLFLHVIKPIGSSTRTHKLSRYSLKRGRKPTLPSASAGARLALA